MDTRTAYRSILQRCTEDGDCWLWLGAKDQHGYGVVCVEGKTRRAHRVTLDHALQQRGKSLGRRQALHTCDRPSCVNPAHLYPGTPKDNARDRESRNRGSKVRVKGSSVVTAKLTEADIPPIRARLAGGESHRSIASAYGVNRDTIGAIARREAWLHVP